MATFAVLVAPQGQGGGGLLPMLFMWGMIILIFYLLLIRPQRKAQQRHQEMLEGLKKGDEVMTDGGVLGEIIHLKEDRVTVKTAEQTRLEVARSKIARKLNVPESEQ